jgi:hypothetical protein
MASTLISKIKMIKCPAKFLVFIIYQLPVLLFDTIFLWFIIKTLYGSAYQQINSLLIYPLFKIFVSNTSLNYYYPKRSGKTLRQGLREE